MIPEDKIKGPNERNPLTWHRALHQLLEKEGIPQELHGTGRVWAFRSKSRSSWKIHYVVEILVGPIEPRETIKICSCEGFAAAGVRGACEHTVEVGRMES